MEHGGSSGHRDPPNSVNSGQDGGAQAFQRCPGRGSPSASDAPIASRRDEDRLIRGRGFRRRHLAGRTIDIWGGTSSVTRPCRFPLRKVAWVESWHGLEKGWVKVGMDITGFLQSAPCSTWWLAAFEIPIEGTRLGDNVSRTLA